jgi:hypothetical protein
MMPQRLTFLLLAMLPIIRLALFTKGVLGVIDENFLQESCVHFMLVAF